jgi:cation:H+ antiporter
MTLALFSVTALVIVVAGVRLARYGDVIGGKSGLGGSWVAVVLLAATTSLPEVGAALALPTLGVRLATETGL